MPLDVGSWLGPYEVIGLIGSGGMGEVYRARDARLERDVAIKILQAGSSGNPDGRRRFEREARMVAALSHPNICQIFDVGADYLVLEYVDGQPLSGPVPAEQALGLARQIAGALQAAHAHGIIHRDLKPANILVRDGLVKVLDFGLAKQLDRETAVLDQTVALNTEPGLVVGTLAYMSPEQADGRPADERSDIFSFGAVLYELLSGRRAFDGRTAGEVMGAVIHRNPPPLEPATPLTRIVERCLAKLPWDRFQNAGDLTQALERLTPWPAPSPAQRASIAVLPFADLSAGKDQEWFGDGLAEEVINALSRVRGLKVIARTSAFAFKGRQDDVRTIAATLGVGAVLEGSVRRSGERVRVTAQLIHAADSTHLWSQRYDRDLSDVFEIQDDIASAIVEALQVTLLTAAPRPACRPMNAAAHDAYLKGRYYRAQFKHDSLRRSLEFLEQAVSLDPECALARWDIAFTMMTFAIAGMMSASEVAARMRQQATRALDLDPHLTEAHAALALSSVLEYDWISAGDSFRRAVAPDYVSPDVRLLYAQWYLVPHGRFADALEQVRLGLQDDPLNLFLRNSVGMLEMMRGNEDRSVVAFRELLELNDRMFVPNLWLCTLALRRGRFGEALTIAERAFAIEPGNVVVKGTLAGVLERNGAPERARRLRGELEADGTIGGPAGLACYHLARGEADEAAASFERAIAQHDPCTSWIVPRMFGDLLTSSRHWPALAKAMNLSAVDVQTGAGPLS